MVKVSEVCQDLARVSMSASGTTPIVPETNQFHVHGDLYLQKKAMFTSHGVPRALGKRNAVVSIIQGTETQCSPGYP
jgi:hypothetical protein